MSKLKQQDNKEKIGTILDRNIVKKIKDRSHKEGRSISEIIQDAILKYEDIEPAKLGLRKSANDALFLAVATRLRVTAIVSADSIFKNIQGIILYSPDDINE